MRREQHVTLRQGEREPGDAEAAARLAAALAADDGEAAYEILKASTARLRGYLRLRFENALGGRQAVEEIIATAIWSAIERGDTYRPERGSPALWLWRIGVNAAQDELRRRATRRRHETRAGRDAPAVSDERREALKAAVRQAIAGLDDGRHRAILRFDLEHGGLAPARAIANELGLAEQTVLNLRSEARRRLRPLLEEVLRHGA